MNIHDQRVPQDKLEGWESIDAQRTRYLKPGDQNRHAVAVYWLYPIDSTFKNRHAVAVLISWNNEDLKQLTITYGVF